MPGAVTLCLQMRKQILPTRDTVELEESCFFASAIRDTLYKENLEHSMTVCDIQKHIRRDEAQRYTN